MARQGGARNLHFVGGEPIVNLPAILAFLSAHEVELRGLPLVINSNLYAGESALGLLEAVADTVVADLKWGNGACAEAWSMAADYLPVVLAALGRLVGSGVDVIVRHLLVPGHRDCCTRPVLESLHAFPGVSVNLMTAYLPFGVAEEEGSGPEAHMPGLSERRARLAEVLAMPEARGLTLLVDGDVAPG